MKKIFKLLNLALVACVMVFAGCKEKQKLYVFTWADYIDPELLQKFEAESNCHVVIDTFADNESMYAKLMAGGTGYDIIMPTEYFMPLLVQSDLIDKLDMEKLPNAKKNVDKMFLSDWTFEYNVPYAFSCTGILWRKDKVPEDLTFQDWNDMFDERLKGRVCMMNDIREVLGLGLKMNGFSVNSTNEEELAKAVEIAKLWKSRSTKMDNEAYRTGIPAGEFVTAMSYNSDAIMLLADEAGSNLGYIVPTNGTAASMDVFCILKNSKSKDLAHKFIDMFYVPKNAAQNSEYNGVPMPVVGSFDLLSDKYKAIPFMKVTDELKAKCENIRDVGDAIELYSKAWDKVKGSN